MSGLKVFTDLFDHTMPASESAEGAAEQAKRAMVAVLELAEIEGELACNYPWELSPAVRRELTRRAGWAPPGGWAAVAGMMAASGLVVSESSRFKAIATVQEVQAIPAERLRLRALEAFTRWLSPPAPTAHLFVSLNVHPLWGLKLVSSLESPYRHSGPGPLRTEMMPDHMLDPVSDAIFGTISVIIATLRRLRSDCEYELAALYELCSFAAQSALEAIDVVDDPGVLRVFMERPARGLFDVVQNQTWRELVDDVFVAVGAIRVHDNGRFVVAPGAFHGLRVGEFEPVEQDLWLSRMTGTEARFLNAS